MRQRLPHATPADDDIFYAVTSSLAVGIDMYNSGSPGPDLVISSPRSSKIY